MFLFLYSDPKQIIPDPNPGKKSGSNRIRIHNTAWRSHWSHLYVEPARSLEPLLQQKPLQGGLGRAEHVGKGFALQGNLGKSQHKCLEDFSSTNRCCSWQPVLLDLPTRQVAHSQMPDPNTLNQGAKNLLRIRIQINLPDQQCCGAGRSRTL